MTLLNYTDAATIRGAMGGQETVQDTLLDKFAGIASRSVDHICAQTSDPDCQNYFKLEDVANEILTNGSVDNNGHIVCYPHKSFIQSVSAFGWSTVPGTPQVTADPATIVVKSRSVEVWTDATAWRGKPFLITISYRGGMATELAGLDPLLVDAATVLAIRKYKEERSGMSDVVGVVELGTIQYSTGIPASVVRDLQPFQRVTPWT